jgi:two-component system sensor histidine kinase UhpB
MLAAEQDLAIDRVAQESLTNVARHADAQRADLALQRADGRVVLVVRDDGRGIEDENLHGAGVGMAGMRERALLVGGRLAVQRSGRGGTEVRLDVPVRETS